MSDQRKLVNWAEIKKRYLCDEKPAQIASDYYYYDETGEIKPLRAKQISNKAQFEGWVSQKKEMMAHVNEALKDEISHFKSLVVDLRRTLLENLQEQESALEPLFFGKIKANPYTKAVLSAGLEAVAKDEEDATKRVSKIEVSFVDFESQPAPAEDSSDDSDGQSPLSGA